jgi:flagellar protein FliO/FliZ
MLPSFASMIPLTTFVWPAIALAGVLALILLTQRFVQRTGLHRRNAGHRLAVLEALAIDPRRRLHLVRCDERTVLLLTGGAEDLVVGWLPEARP